MSRVAVQAGGAWLRVATEDRVVAEVPAARGSVSTVLAGLFDGPLDELVVVGGPVPVGPVRARTVTSVPGAVAALAGHPAPAVVVDVGHRRTEITLVGAGRVVEARCVPVGGAELDTATARVLAGLGVDATPEEVRHVREELSLFPEARVGASSTVVAADDLRAALSAALGGVVAAVDAVVAAAAPGRAPPVLLIGGVARTPLLAELLDDAGVAGVRVAERPDCAAVLGALRLPPEPATAVPAPDPVVERSWLPPVRPARSRTVRAGLGAVAAAGAAACLLAAGAALPGPTPPPAADELVQYGYAVALPAGWAHTGGAPESRRSLLTRITAPGGTDLVSVERGLLGYDSDAEPRRARAELRAVFAAAVAGGEPLSGFDDSARFAGRDVVTYREAGTATSGDVDWYVLLEGDTQFSVGCRHTPAGAPAVRAACTTVVGSVRRSG